MASPHHIPPPLYGYQYPSMSGYPRYDGHNYGGQRYGNGHGYEGSNGYGVYSYGHSGFGGFGQPGITHGMRGYSHEWDLNMRDHHRGGFGYGRNHDYRFNANGPEIPPKQGSYGQPHAFPHPHLSFFNVHHSSAGSSGGAPPGPPPPHPPSPQGPPPPPPPPPLPLPSSSGSTGTSGGSVISVQGPPSGPVGTGYMIPYHDHEFGINGGHSNSILPPFHPFSDRCKFPPSAVGRGGPGGQTAVFHRVGFGARFRSTYIFKVIRAERLEDCERACLESRDYTCRSFNYRGFAAAENCELSQFDSKQFKLDNPAHFEQSTQYDYYERDSMAGAGAGPGFSSADCIEVAQTCTPDGMEFTLKTPEGFYGRIYTYGFYDSCFYDGNGGTLNVLRISRVNGFPRCGTQQYGDAMTNIVVVQFSDFVQTSRDKKYNLTCYFSGPGEAVVTSNYLDAKTDG